MPDFQRARSMEQKEQRMEEIKAAADELFKTMPYHEITLTSIADNLSWSRANLYKYITTKEEIYLELAGDKRSACFLALKSAFSPGFTSSLPEFAKVWAKILNDHRDYLHYSAILLTIIETNVSVKRLAEFKKKYYRDAGEIIALLSSALRLPVPKTEALFYDVYYHAVGLCGSCLNNPLIREALKQIPMEATDIDFPGDMQRFILMCLNAYCREQ